MFQLICFAADVLHNKAGRVFTNRDRTDAAAAAIQLATRQQLFYQK